MSIRTNPMKAVAVLLKRVKSARSKFHEYRGRDESFDGKLEKLTQVLNKIDDLFMKVKKNQDELLDTLHEVDGHLRKLDKKRLDQDMDGICKRIRDSAHKLLPMDAFDDDSSQQYKNQLQLPQGPQPRHINLAPSILDSIINQTRFCLMSLSIFPEDAVLKKRQAIYWWIGQGCVKQKSEGTAEEEGEKVMHELLELKLIVPYGNGKSPFFNKFQINAHIYPFLKSLLRKEYAWVFGFYDPSLSTYVNCNWLVLEQRRVTLDDTHPIKPVDDTRPIRSVVNVGTSYLIFDSQRLSKMLNLHVLQLGRWQDSPLHHIEVGSEEFLKELRKQKYLRHLSLRGISRIFALPPSIAQLEGLVILDLKACHNLETLPEDISSMKSLTHLILSQCYLLGGMPKGIDKLTKLQVLKGFVLGSPGNTPCTISDLAHLKNLRRLSIHIESEAVIKEEDFRSLGELNALEHLKISWGVSDIRYSNIYIDLPLSLRKLHLQNFRGRRIPKWLQPSQIPWTLAELNITGGKLESLYHDDEDMNVWHIHIVRLKYLKHLEVDLPTLQRLFPYLMYALIKAIPNHQNTEWSIKFDSE